MYKWRVRHHKQTGSRYVWADTFGEACAKLGYNFWECTGYIVRD